MKRQIDELVIINPYGEQIRRNRFTQQRLSHYDVEGWAEDFINEL